MQVGTYYYLGGHCAIDIWISDRNLIKSHPKRIVGIIFTVDFK